MRLVKHIPCVRKGRILMPFPESHIHVAIGFPGIRTWNKGLRISAFVGCNPAQKKLVPFVEMDIDIPDVFVTLPVVFLLFLIPGKIKGSISLGFGEGGNKLV